MMPGFRHRNRPTKMHDKGERCFYLNSGNDHSSNTHKVITPAGIATYSAHCTFGYRRQAFQGEVLTWGGSAITSSRPWPSTASSPGAAPDPLAAETSSRGGSFPAATPAASAVPRGGGIPPMSSSGVAATSATAATSSRGGGIPAAVPAATTSAAAGTPSRGDYFGGCGDIFPRRGYSRRGSSGDYFGDCGDIFPRWGYSRRGSSGGGYR